MTKDDFLIEIYQFKQQKLYEEALSCIQLLFEKNIVDSDIIYELADTYLCYMIMNALSIGHKS